MQNVVKPKASAVTQYSIPAHLAEQNPELIKFLEYYYKWMCQDGEALDLLQNLLEYRDIDKTSELYTQLITRQFLDFIPVTATVNRKLLAHRIKDFYKAKGTLPSYDFVMNVLFSQHPEIQWQSEKVLRPSSTATTRDAAMSVYADYMWTQDAVGTTITQTYPTEATALIERLTPTLINGKIVNILDIDPETVSGAFSPYGQVRTLRAGIDRSWTLVDVYYTPISYTGTTLTISTTSEVARTYPGLIVRQVGSNFRAVVASVNSRGVISNQTHLSLELSNATGTYSTGDLYLISSTIEATHYTKGDFQTGIISPSVVDVIMVNGGALSESGEDLTYIGGTGSPFTAIVNEIGGGPVDHIEVVQGGYGYAVGDPLTVTSGESGAGLSAIVSTVDGVDASVELTMELDNFHIVNGGRGYAVGDIITIRGGFSSPEAFPTILTVSSVDKTRALKSIDVSNSGYGYQYVKLALRNDLTNTIVPGFAATASVLDGTIKSITVTQFPTLTTPNVTVLINGAGATADAIVTAGAISNIILNTGGYNYVNPKITIVSALQPSRLAQFSITKNGNGVISAINLVDGGAGYSPTVTVVIKEMTGAGATAVPVINNVTGPVTGLTITQRGDYYDLPNCFDVVYDTQYTTTLIDPLVIANGQTLTIPNGTFIQIGGSLGSGLALNLKYRVKLVDVENPGHNYKVIALDATDGIGKGAVLQPTIENGVIAGFTMSNNGSGYTYARVQIIGTGSEFSGVATIVAGRVTGIVIYNGGHGYTVGDTVVITGDGVNAAASLVIHDGVVTRFTVLNGGQDYAYDTAVTFAMDPVLHPSAVAGSFTPVIDRGQIDSITVISGGSGYIASQTNRLKNEDGTFLLWDVSTFLDFDSPYDVPLVSAGTPAGLAVNLAPLGAVVSANVISGGSGYYSTGEIAPLEVYITTVSGHGAVIIPVLEQGKLATFKILNGGVGYANTDTATVVGGGGTGGTVTPVFYQGKLTELIITHQGANYKYGTASLVLGDGYDADMYPEVITSISEVRILNGGSGYINPYITIADTTGVGAVLVPEINSAGTITNVRIVSGGKHYTAPVLTVHSSILGVGAGAVFAVEVKRYIESIIVKDPGEDYTHGEVYLTGDGDDASIVVNVEKKGSIFNPTVYGQGSGYTRSPKFVFLDVSGVGEISGVKILNGGDLYDAPPVISIPDKVFQNNVIATGASFVSWGARIGAIKNVAFESFGADWYEPPLFNFPVNTIVDRNANFTVGETIHVERYPYTPDPFRMDLLTEAGDIIWAEFREASLGQEDGLSALLTEAGDTIDTESTGDLEQEFDEIEHLDGTKSIWWDKGPSAAIYDIDFSRNLVELKDATDAFLLVCEDGAELRSESDLNFADESSNGIYIGDAIVGTQSGARTVLTWFNRASGVHKTDAIGFTDKKMVNATGVLNNPMSKLHNGERIQDFAYVVRSGATLAQYEEVLRATVHPAGYAMFADTILSNFTQGHKVTIPLSFGIKGASSSFQTKLNIKNAFVDMSLGKHKSLGFYDATRKYWYTTAGGIFADFTFENYDPTSTSYISDIAPLTAFEPWVARTWIINADVIAGSPDVQCTVPAGVTMGDRIVAYDALGNSIFIENRFLLEDGSYLLLESSTPGAEEFMEVDEPMVTVQTFISTLLTMSQKSLYTGPATIVIEEIPSLLRWLDTYDIVASPLTINNGDILTINTGSVLQIV